MEALSKNTKAGPGRYLLLSIIEQNVNQTCEITDVDFFVRFDVGGLNNKTFMCHPEQEVNKPGYIKNIDFSIATNIAYDHHRVFYPEQIFRTCHGVNFAIGPETDAVLGKVVLDCCLGNDFLDLARR